MTEKLCGKHPRCGFHTSKLTSKLASKLMVSHTPLLCAVRTANETTAVKVKMRPPSTVEPPRWRRWEPERASAEERGREITLWAAPGASATGVSTHRHDFTRPTLASRVHDGKRHDVSKPTIFDGTATYANEYRWPAHEEPVDTPLPTPPQPHACWPVVSFHGAVSKGEKAFRDAVIDQAERKAWQEEGKTLPERALYHGEDETRTFGKAPLTCAGSCNKTRARAPQPQSGSNRRVTSMPPKITWRQHEKRAVAPSRSAGVRGDVAAADAAAPPSSYRRSRADEFDGAPPWLPVPEPQSESAARPKPPRSAGSIARRSAHALVSANEWKRLQRERARVAMPGGTRDAAATGRVASAHGGGPSAWRLPGRNGLTGAGREPLRLGEAPPRGTGRPNAWHVVAASRYK